MPNARERNSPLLGARRQISLADRRVSESDETAPAGPSQTAYRPEPDCRSPSACRPSARATASALASFFELVLGSAPGRARASVSVPEPALALSTALERVLASAPLTEPEPALASVPWTALEPVLERALDRGLCPA